MSTLVWDPSLGSGSLLTPALTVGPRSGRAEVYLTRPDGLAYPPFKVISAQVDRAVNRLLTWQVVVPAAEPVSSDTLSAVGMQVATGWTCTIVQEDVTPYGAKTTNLLTSGEVTRHEYSYAQGDARLTLVGVSRNDKPLRGQINGPISYGTYGGANVPISVIANDICGFAIPCPSWVVPALTVTFNEGTKLAALLNLCKIANLILRETWDGDQLELVSALGVPDSGYTLTNIEQVDQSLVG